LGALTCHSVGVAYNLDVALLGLLGDLEGISGVSLVSAGKKVFRRITLLALLSQLDVMQA